MKHYLPLFIVVFFYLNVFAQTSSGTTAKKETEKALPTTDKPSNEKVIIVAYDVEETINMKFGGRKTTYTVTSLDLVDKNELGPNNTRVVKPKYIKAKPKEEVPVINKLPVVTVVNPQTVIEPVKVTRTVTDGKLQYTKIKIIENYERVLEKGYKTEDMLLAVADYRFFANDLVTAAKWYSQLFEFCPDELDPVYYFRYAKSLEAVGENAKAKKMMELYQIKKM